MEEHIFLKVPCGIDNETLPLLDVVNVLEGEVCDRNMTTGRHSVRDIRCCKCDVILGWKYVSQEPDEQD